MGFSKNRIRYLINKKNKFQTKKKYKKRKGKRQKINSFRKKKKNIRKSSIKKKQCKKKNIAKKKRKVYIIQSGGNGNLNPYDTMIRDILQNVFEASDASVAPVAPAAPAAPAAAAPDNWYDTSFLYNKNKEIVGTYIRRSDAINKFKTKLNKQEGQAGQTVQEGPEGPAGPAGPAGQEGPGGQTGIDKAIKNITCKADETMVMIDANSNVMSFNKTKCPSNDFDNMQNSIISIFNTSF